VSTFVNVFKNGFGAAEAGSAVPSSNPPAARRIDMRGIRVMWTSEAKQRATCWIPLRGEYGNQTRKVQTRAAIREDDF
jgi:hypothetical protein